MRKANLEIRVRIMEAGLHLYQVAEKLNISETTFSRKLRKELTNSDKGRVLNVISELIKEGKYSFGDCIKNKTY